MNKLCGGLFGKQDLNALKQEPVAIRSVSTILEDLCKLEDLDWTNYAFSREPLNGKFDDEERRNLAQKAIDCGTNAAIEYMERYDAYEPAALAKALGIVLSYPKQPQNAARVLFAEYCPPGEINIFMDAIDRVSSFLEETKINSLLGNIRISDILLGHELYHVVEKKKSKSIWTQTYKINLWGIGPIRNHSKILVLSEIAAMAFSKAINKMEYSPYVLDAFLVYGYSEKQASLLYEEIMTFSGNELQE